MSSTTEAKLFPLSYNAERKNNLWRMKINALIRKRCTILDLCDPIIQFLWHELLWNENIHYISIVWGPSRLFFFKEINTFIQHGCIKFTKVTIKIFIMLQIICILNKCCSFSFSIHRFIEKNVSVSTKNISRTTVFSTDDNNTFLEQIILEWFLKDHVTLKTED